MDDSVDVMLQEQSTRLLYFSQNNRSVALWTSAIFTGVYGLWAMFVMPGLKVPFRLKVPYVPSGKAQTMNVMKLLEGREGRLADLGSGDGRLVFEASSAGFKCTGFEINKVLLAYSRVRALWRGTPPTQANFVGRDFWKADLSPYNNVTVFLTPAVMEVLEEKLVRELPEGARVVVCRFPFPRWPHTCCKGEGLDKVWAYDISTVPKPYHSKAQ
ncbi:adenine nucleotide translocase lysine N-methyltransferase [Esox lucius]|uniref:Uncharacterized protein n=1 Tax=Esox lucius TaxID=8010 RepID=A0AAY5L6D2_ESOLU|nr:adenine nucleotide translocase lysine N-methyltransferase [Esox lucius]XP_010887922.2 adenine nucleotide translocase lysine N-methyltransferase [Esox lucius]